MAVAPTAAETPAGVPPHNPEAETSVLGAILMSEPALDSVLLDVGLKPEHFYRPRHQLVFRSMLRLKEKAEPEPVDALTVSDELRRTGELEDAGGEEYVHSLPAGVVALGHYVQYARIVKNQAILRRLLDTTRGIQEEVLAHRGDPRELTERGQTGDGKERARHEHRPAGGGRPRPPGGDVLARDVRARARPALPGLAGQG